MSNLFIDPEVRVLSSYDSRVDAWKISRPYLTEEPKLEDLLHMDLMVNAMCGYVFYVRSSILMRDLLFTLRPAPAWARSNRTIEFTEDTLQCSSEYKGIRDKEFKYNFMDILSDLKAGIPQDYAKKKLPMAFSTEYTIALDDRTLVAFLRMLRDHCPDLYAVYGKLFLEAIGKDDTYVTDRACKDIFKSYAVSEYELEHRNETAEAFEMFIGCYEVSGNLMAQLIRTSNNRYHNSLYNVIDGNNLNGLATLQCDDTVVVSVYADKESFRKVLSTRSCWFGQWDMEDKSSWSSIIGPYVKDMEPREFLALLPCKGNCKRCKIYEDMKLRLHAQEVNPPCAILTQKPSIVEARGRKYNSNSEIFKKWVELVEAGMIKDNPDNSDRLVYEEALKSKDDNSEWGIFKNIN